MRIYSVHMILRAAALATLLSAASPIAYAQEKAQTVTVKTVNVSDFTVTARLPGRIKASTVSEVRPQVGGIIRDRLFKEGARVEVGQTLYKIEDDTYRAAVVSAKAAVAEAQASYDIAVIQARRAEELLAKNSGSASDRDDKVAERNKSGAALQKAQADLKTSEIDLDRTTVTAPITGIIGFSETTPGALVSAQQTTALTTIRTLDPVYVDVTQSATDLLRWNASGGAAAFDGSVTASMTLPDGTTYTHKGALRAAEPKVEATTGMVTLRISFANPERRLLPGLYVEVDLPQSVAKDAILVPQGAVMRNAKGEPYVWIVEDNKVAVRSLTILTSSGNDWVTTKGLSAGDQVITSGFQKVSPGSTVEIAADASADDDATANGGN